VCYAIESLLLLLLLKVASMLAHKGLKISPIGLALKGLSKKKVSENSKIRVKFYMAFENQKYIPALVCPLNGAQSRD
jgi:hypothetical protein